MVLHSYSPHRLLIHWRSTLTVTVACFVWWRACLSASATGADVPTLVTSLVPSTVPPLPVLIHMCEQFNSQVRHQADYPYGETTAQRLKSPDAEAWAKFEAEYRPEPRSSSPVKRQIESAKYGLDVTVFAVDRFVKNLREHADFGFDQGRLRPTRSNSRGGFLDNPRMKLDLDLTHGKPYIGTRIVIAFGN
jgi:hypothetical protein